LFSANERADNSSTDGEDGLDDDEEGEMTGMQLLLACAEGRTHSSAEARKVMFRVTW
jgi:hypothetical protein